MLIAAPLLAMAPAIAVDRTEAALVRCLDDPAQASTADQVECEAVAARSYDRRMNVAYTALMQQSPPDAATALRNAQRAWLAFREREHQAQAALFGSRQGTLYVPMSAAAATRIVRDRAVQLEQLVQVLAIEG